MILPLAQFRSDLRSWYWLRTKSGREWSLIKKQEAEKYGPIAGERPWPTKWLALSLAYSLTRWKVVSNIDPNEDFNCCYCGKPVFRRVLFCSRYCSNAETSDHLSVERLKEIIARLEVGDVEVPHGMLKILRLILASGPPFDLDIWSNTLADELAEVMLEVRNIEAGRDPSIPTGAQAWGMRGE